MAEQDRRKLRNQVFSLFLCLLMRFSPLFSSFYSHFAISLVSQVAHVCIQKVMQLMQMSSSKADLAKLRSLEELVSQKQGELHVCRTHVATLQKRIDEVVHGSYVSFKYLFEL